MSKTIIAIDGPAASGKSSVAKRVAAALGILYVNSGAMYRAFTWHVLQNGGDPEDRAAVLELLGHTSFDALEGDGQGTITVNGMAVPEEGLGSEAVNAGVSAIAAIPEVREQLVLAQRAYGADRSVVMEGRDIGSVVFPDADHKFYVTASVEVREARRLAEGIVDQIAERDRKDSSRKTAPLSIAEGATVVDSSDQTLEETVDTVLGYIRG